MLRAFKHRVISALWHVTLLRSVVHHTWFYRWVLGPSSNIPRLRFTFTEPQDVTDRDIALCERLITAYKRIDRTSEIRPDGVWSTIIDRHFERLNTLLEREDAAQLARILASMFREDFVYGIASGALVGRGATRFISARVESLKCLDGLVSLSEYLGTVRTENAEQGLVAQAFEATPAELVRRVEGEAGIAIGFPRVGAPYGLMLGDSLVTLESPEHLYVALRINAEIANRLPSERSPAIVEIGAGFGGTAYWLLKLRALAVAGYTIIDLPLMNVIQGYFLAQAFGHDHVSLYGEPEPPRGERSAPIRILPTTAIESFANRTVDVLINENSIPEMPLSAVEGYVSWAGAAVRGFFYSYNHEGFVATKGGHLVLVPEVIARVGGFRRESRNYSWLRRGYVEEVYVPVRGADSDCAAPIPSVRDASV